MLTPRRVEIFKAIVDEYIKTAEPVGSKTLQAKYSLSYSSATIRGDMQALEELGFLEKTHTSSGRIPSTKGYKFYCEHLLKESTVDTKMELAIQNAFDVSNLNMEEAVQQSCQILTEMTNLTSGVIGPNAERQRLQHIKFFPIDNRNAVVVFITNAGHTETKQFHFDEDISLKDIESCTEILNGKLKDELICDIPQRMEEIKPELAKVVQRHDLLFTAFVQAFVKFANENIYFSGKDRILYQPEFEDINKLKQLLGMLENKQVWRQLSGSSNAIATTSTGTELTWIDDVAVVKSSFRVNDDQTGQLMIVGPSRMNYGKVVSVVDYMAKVIEKMYRTGGNGGSHER